MRLLLFDIDGTLINSNKAGRLALGAALTDLFGSAGPLDSYDMSGKTDARIVTDLLLALGFAEQEITTRLPTVYQRMAKRAEDHYPRRGIMPCPGVMALLDALRKRNDTLLGLLTGNADLTAPLKLKAAGIDPGWFPVAAYGSDHIDRNNLPAIAWERARELTGLEFTGDNTVIVGDTPADIACAHAGNATAVAVATGWHEAGTLAQYHPDYLFDSLSDTSAVLDALLAVKERG